MSLQQNLELNFYLNHLPCPVTISIRLIINSSDLLKVIQIVLALDLCFCSLRNILNNIIHYHYWIKWHIPN